MFLKILLVGIAFAAILFISDFLLPKLKQRYKLHKEIKKMKRKQEAFRIKMQELEIK